MFRILAVSALVFIGCSKDTIKHDEYDFFTSRSTYLNAALQTVETDYKRKLFDEHLFRLYIQSPEAFNHFKGMYGQSIKKVGNTVDPLGLFPFYEDGLVSRYREGFVFLSSKTSRRIVEAVGVDEKLNHRFDTLTSYVNLVNEYNAEKGF